MQSKKILVIGTTADYIELLIKRFPEKLFFVTDIKERQKWKELDPGQSLEGLFDLNNQDSVPGELIELLHKKKIEPSGIVCFDCESLALAAIIATKLNLPFSSLESVINCRSKFLSKSIWKKNGIHCPDSEIIRNENDAIRFLKSLNGSAVMKPLTGSGSELVLLCNDEKSCLAGYKTILKKLKNHHDNRMYSLQNMKEGENPREDIVMEQYIPGDEYSCDFIIEKGNVKILRLAKKIINHDISFGTVSAYILKVELPEAWDIKKLERSLQDASKSLGLNHTIAMVDFKIYNDEVYFFEITPRQGGDCLPFLIKESSGFDIFKATLDFSEGKKVIVPSSDDWKKVVGLPLISSQRGVLKKLDAGIIVRDSRVISYNFKRSIGDEIELPPEDYGSRILGYVIFQPETSSKIEEQCLEISRKLIVEME